MKKCIIFDLDGTLIDTSKGIVEAVSYTIEKLGLPSLTDSQLLSFIGPPVQESFQHNCCLDRYEAQCVTDLYRSYYINNSLLHATLYNGVLQMLDDLKCKNYSLGVATYKRNDCVPTLLQHFGLDVFFSCIKGADQNNKLKKKDLIEDAVRSIGADAEQSIYIGDTIHDATAASENAMDFVAVLYGFGFKTESDLRNIDHYGFVKNPNEIVSVVQSLRNIC